MITTEKIKGKRANIGIIGLGYVGLPLLMEFVEAGFPVTGFDTDPAKVKSIMTGKSYIKHIPAARIKKACATGRLKATTDLKKLAEMDAILICVPTPLNEHREPEMSYVFNSSRSIAKTLKKGQLIVLESTTYPGTTDHDMRKILEETGLKVDKDFYLAYSPEREDPNNKNYSTGTIPKVVGGCGSNSLEMAVALYNTIIVKVIPVSSAAAAESCKLLENIFRSVNIALVNEMKMLFDRMGIDIWEVIEAASTKPFGYMPFYPGPGLGGHCIPIDPFYLTWKAHEYGMSTRFIELAGEINVSMPHYIVNKLADALNDRKKSIKGSKILVLGLAYKRDIDDVRESPSLELITLLTDRGAKVDYNDPYVPKTHKMRNYDLGMKSVPLTKTNLRKYDCVLVATDHSEYDPDFIGQHANLVVDSRNMMKKVRRRKNIIKA